MVLGMRKDAYNGEDSSADEHTILTLAEAAALTGYSPSTLRRWDRNGALVALRTPGKHLRYRKADLLSQLYRDGRSA